MLYKAENVNDFLFVCVCVCVCAYACTCRWRLVQWGHSRPGQSEEHPGFGQVGKLGGSQAHT